MVWIKSGLSSNQSFNALKKQEILLCPLAASQYLQGAWQSKSAQIFKGTWLPWWTGQLYDSGQTYPEITGGWRAVNQRYSSDQGSEKISLTERESSLLLTVPARQYGYPNCGAMMTVNKIDLTNVSTITATGSPSSTHSMNRLYVMDSDSDYSSKAPAAIALTAGQTVLDVSGLSGEYFVAINMFGTAAVTYELTSCIMK